MTWQQQLEKSAQHYADLAQQPGWFQHCKQQIIAMEAEQGGHWVGLRARWGELLTQAGFKPHPSEKDGWWLIPDKRPPLPRSGSRTTERHP